MHSGTYEILEFDKVRDALASFTYTPQGRALALGLEASASAGVVVELLAQTTEARRFQDDGGTWPLAELPNIASDLERLSVPGRSLDIESFLRLGGFAAIAEKLRPLMNAHEQELPHLATLAKNIPSLAPLGKAIREVIDFDSGEIRDDASPELSRLREKLRRSKTRLDKLLDAALKHKDHQKILQEPLVTTRNDRPVLPVRAECRSQFPGIVHGASSSGATLFIEPLKTVELNNAMAALRAREEQEMRRILAVLTERAQAFREDLVSALETIAILDLIQAKARLSDASRGEPPTMGADEELALVQARHPLLIHAVASRAGLPPSEREPIPLDFKLSGGKRALVFTGPNTGGKTVALKTAGLLALMAQSGLHPPASSASRFPVFNAIFADIGDDQSIASSLSTFSAHLARAVTIEKELQLPALVILDEVGTGTDPAEGGALGTALVEHFVKRGALVLVSTHHGLLKAYATTTEGVGAASFDFDPVTYAPTYRISVGAAGRSLAFEMAGRLGLSPGIVERARQLQGERERQVGALLERLESDSAELEEERRRLSREQRAVAGLRARLEEEADAEQQKRAKRLASFRESLEDELRTARRAFRDLIEEGRQDLRKLRQEKERLAEPLKRIERELTEKMESIAAPLQAQARTLAPKPAMAELRVGMQVLVASLGVKGQVLELLGRDDAEVRVRDKKFRVARDQLEPLDRQPTVETSQQAQQAQQLQQAHGAHLSTPEPKSMSSELNLIGRTVDEAIAQADKFIDDAYLSEYRQVRLIHGHGTGRLRNALRTWLSSHPLVERHESDQQDGVTVVELKN